MMSLEQHADRPFQKQFSLDLKRYALANQMDYLLYRAEQELEIRKIDPVGIQDGGLDEDFYLFTRLFYQKGYLTTGEFNLCERLYTSLREVLPPPDLIILLTAPLNVIAERYTQRDRVLEIAELQDLSALENLLEEWIGRLITSPLIIIDAGKDGPDYSKSIQSNKDKIRQLFEA